MEITINNQLRNLEAQNSLTVQQLLDMEIPEKQKGVAVALNNKVISKTEWGIKKILHKDNVLIIKATQGG